MSTPTDHLTDGARIMGICNSCRYCEAYCAVFVAMERRTAFERADMTALANLCHNCGECLYACQYAPPHEFAINVPRTLAQIRRDTYDTFAWPAPLARLFRGRNAITSVALALVLSAAVWTVQAPADAATITRADFYAVVPHDVLVTVFTGVGILVLAALGVGVRRFWRESASGYSGSLTLGHWRPCATCTRAAWTASTAAKSNGRRGGGGSTT
jgi:citrate/tricarballylate utilization protein